MKEKIIGFFTDVVKEMNKVTWPKKDELRDSTIIVLVVCLIVCRVRLRRRQRGQLAAPTDPVSEEAVADGQEMVCAPHLFGP